MKGAANVSLSMRDIAKVEIPLVPIEKQKSLADMFVSLNEKQATLFAEYEKQSEYGKLLRQNILQDAIEGKLTADWRKQNPVVKGNPDFDAKALFEKIQEEKCHADSKSKKIAMVEPVETTEMPFEIPAGWKWVRLGEIINEPPKNGYSPKAVNFETPTKTLKLGAVTYGIFNKNEYKYIDEVIPLDSCYWLKNGDILIERSNSIEYVGICAIYTGKDNEFIYPDLLMKFRVNKLLSNEMIHKILIAPYNRKYFKSKAKGSQKTMPKINQETVLNTLIPLAPITEQNYIISILKQKISNLEQLENQIIKCEVFTKQLVQVILKDAFEKE